MFTPQLHGTHLSRDLCQKRKEDLLNIRSSITSMRDFFGWSTFSLLVINAITRKVRGSGGSADEVGALFGLSVSCTAEDSKVLYRNFDQRFQPVLHRPWPTCTYALKHLRYRTVTSKVNFSLKIRKTGASAKHLTQS